MKLGVSINLFNGEELLESCLKSIRPYADFIIVVYQNTSNFGTDEKDLKPLINDMQNKNLLDMAIFHIPSTNFEDLKNKEIENEKIYYGIYNEILKRNTSLNNLRNMGCTHLLDLDTDEFYVPEQIIKAKEKIEKGNYDASFCKMQTYYKYADTILTPPETYYVPFIYKITPKSKFEQIENSDFPVYTDGKRRIRTAYPYVFSRPELEMHHFSFVRKDKKSLLSKFNNCSSKINFPNGKAEKLTKHWEQFKRGETAMLNGGSKGVHFVDTQTIKPFVKLKF